MLYVNTKNKNLTYTSHQALTVDPAEGMAAPIRLPFYSPIELSQLFGLRFADIVAHILNKFFSKSISGDQIDHIINKFQPQADYLDRKTLLIHFGGSLTDLERSVFSLLCEDYKPSVWAKCAIRIALLFALSNELFKCGIRGADYAVVADDVLSFVPVFYGKLMGLPVRRLITSSATEGSVWNYLHKSIHSSDEVFEYFSYGMDGNDGIVSEISSFVVSSERAGEVIINIQSSYNKCIDSTAAFSYGALQDHRSVTGEHNTTVIFSN